MVTVAASVSPNIMEKYNKLSELLSQSNPSLVEKFVSYCQRVATEKNKDGSLKNTFMQKLSAEKLAELYKRVESEGLEFDGKHVTLQSTGISYDYVAYKNKMLIAYPESQIIVDVVKEGDNFNFSNEDGKITYKHDIKEPFKTAGEDTIIGAYSIIKNKRGEFLTLLSKEEIAKHRSVAKTDYIWRQWFKEMTMKTVIKKACKYHFDDIFQSIEDMDNDNYELDNPIGLDIKLKQQIDEIKTLEDLNKFYAEHSGLGKDFDTYIMIRKNQIEDENS